MNRRTMFSISGTAALVLAVFSAAAVGQPQASCTATAEIVCTEQGAIHGAIEGQTLAFKGIPYARPPLGTLRWKPPVPPMPWEGVREGSRYAAMCPQLVGQQVRGDEDCLYVNVWRPRETKQGTLPVMIWLTGGGNHSLSGQGSPQFGGVIYNGEQLVPQGVVFVSYNLRLGALGFLAHPALDAESPEKISGNYGSLVRNRWPFRIAVPVWFGRWREHLLADDIGTVHPS